jgi:tetratricopeptide (TPR) repeat protein
MKKIIIIIFCILISYNMVGNADNFSFKLPSANERRQQQKAKRQQRKLDLKAIVKYTKIIESNPKNIKAYLLRAKAKYNLKDYSGAIADYDKAIELDPQNPKAFYDRGGIYSLKGHRYYPKAIKDYDRAIALKPKYREAYYRRGLIKIDLNRMTHKIGIYYPPEKDRKDACIDFRKAGELGYDAYNEIREYCQ